MKKAPSVDEALSGRSAFVILRRTSRVPIDPEVSGLMTGFSHQVLSVLFLLENLQGLKNLAGNEKSPVWGRGFERETGFEPATFSLEG